MHTKILEGLEKQISGGPARDGSQMTELAWQGTSYLAIIKKVENQETALELLAPDTHSLNSNLEVTMPHPDSYCLQNHTAPASLASARMAWPASSTLTIMELVVGLVMVPQKAQALHTMLAGRKQK